MKEIFLDTNVVLDYLTKREPFAKPALALFSLAESNHFKINISAISHTTIYYILRKVNSHQEIIENLTVLSDLCCVLPVDKMVLDQAMRSGFMDFEDAVQYYSALQNPICDVVITRNVKDFRSAKIAVMTPDEFLKVKNNYIANK
ncbi:PIN domain-containing protein [Bacteroidia bacterium]|nr:PIN domain-containing protein [Bacteroidia bacterium]